MDGSGPKKGDTAVVFGVGGVGIHDVMWAKSFGAERVIAVDLVDSKLITARNYGADLTFNPSRDDVLGTVARGIESTGYLNNICNSHSMSP